MIKIGIDPGHGGADPGAPGMGYQEKDIVLDVSLLLWDMLIENGNFEVVMTRDSDYRLAEGVGADLTARANALNYAGVEAVISIHMNSAGAPAWGTETYTWNGNSVANAWGDAIHGAIVSAQLPSTDRGRKWADFAILRETNAVACLVEMAFMNSNDVYRVVGQGELWAKAIYLGICNYFGINPSTNKFPTQNTPKADSYLIISAPTATMEQAIDWAKVNNAAQWFIDQAPTFWEVATKYNINPVGVYAQSAKETAFGNFGGVLDETYHNPCGMKNSAGGGDYDPSAHKKFESWFQGIAAQVQHLALYAGLVVKPESLVDPRHFLYLKGTAKRWTDLGGKWAPSQGYGTSILDMIRAIESVPKREAQPEPEAPPETEHLAVPEWGKDDWEKAIELGIIDGTRPNEPMTRFEYAISQARLSK